MENTGLESFITIPRKVASDYRNRLLTRQERDVYVWLRMIASPYGIATIDLSSVASDCFGRGVHENYANKILLSLKSKRYIYYEGRSGRRGSFEVHLGDWPLPRKDKSALLKVRSLDEYFDSDSNVRGAITDEINVESEDGAELSPQCQRSESEDFDVSAMFSSAFEKDFVRASDNDTDTHNEKESDIYRTDRTFKNKILTETFEPNSYEEEQCLTIATALGEEHMDFILGAVRKHGSLLVEQAWKHCKSAKQYNSARNKGAFFNSILQQFVAGYQSDSQTI